MNHKGFRFGISASAGLRIHSNLRKTEILLNALETSGHTYHYFALDISFPELVRTLSAVPTYTNISKTGVYGMS